MASKNYKIVSSHFSGESQNCFSSIEDVEALNARSATFAKVLKRHRIRNTFHGNTFATNEHRECGIH
ncbi:hypothetical protein ALC56_05106 [Trachymyrmex septentrionalis]|uniref:Uncharacterized protein n=1 Tax=Trachymyrmex septentrionalis TaxID=34720 RepID=A0A195FID3_9HYME|nr:hypothetical protein ALC56_05106 [Trachymyrmex septentrionalis]